MTYSFRKEAGSYGTTKYYYVSNKLFEINKAKENLIIDIKNELKELREVEKDLIVKRNKYKKWYFSKNPSESTIEKYNEYSEKIDSIDDIIDYLEDLSFKLENED